MTLMGGPIQRLTGGSGDVAGPASSTDNAVARFDGTTGKLLQNSTAIVGDDGSLTLTSAVASALAVGRQGATSPAFVVNAAAASHVNGIQVTAAASGSSPILEAQGGDLLAGLIIRPKGVATMIDNQLGDTSSYGIGSFSSTAADPARLILYHSKSNTKGTLSNNAASDEIGVLRWSSIGASARQTAAQIIGTVTGTPGSGDSGGGQLAIQTCADGSVTPVSRMTFSPDGKITIQNTVTSGGTTGDQTINNASGSVNFAAAASSLTVTNSLCTTSSIVIATVLTNDTTALIKNVVPGAGSFVITLNAAATAETRVGFLIIN